MEQLINTMLANVKTPQGIPAAKKGEPAGQKEGFQKLLEQKQADAAQSPRPEKTEPAERPQEAQGAQKSPEAGEPQQVQTVPKDGKVLEEQMTLAAMLMMQNPLVAEIAKETPQVLTDPNWEEGLVPVDYVDNEEGSLRIVSWMPEDAAGGEDLDGLNAAASEWIEEQNQAEGEAEALPEAQIEAPEATAGGEGPAVEIKVETGRAETQDADTSDAEDAPELQGAEVETPVFQEVKAVPVKVGEAPKAAQAEKPVEEQIAPRLTEALQNGETRVELQLTPENLGKVTVEMTWTKDSGLVVQLHAENRGTQDLLAKNTSGLAELLGREVQQEVRVEVPRQEESQRQDLYEQQQQQHQRRQQEERRRQQSSGEDFLQQLRLGLIPMDGE